MMNAKYKRAGLETTFTFSIHHLLCIIPFSKRRKSLIFGLTKTGFLTSVLS
jgi:hypothetical protein